MWDDAPDFLLERIFAQLPPRYLYYSSLVCWHWQELFWSERAWERFVFRDECFTQRKFLLNGYQTYTNKYRLSRLITHMARKWSTIRVGPCEHLFHLHNFFKALINFSEYYQKSDDFPFCRVRHFDFNWMLRIRTTPTSLSTYGTGGIILNTLLDLLRQFVNLQRLCLRHLLLENDEANGFFGDLLNMFGMQLRELCVINLTKQAHAFLHFGLFLALRKLVLSPQHLNDDSLLTIASNRSIEIVCIVEDENTHGAVACSRKGWNAFCADAPHIRVWLISRGRSTRELLWQPGAPVVGIVLENRAAQLTNVNAATILEHYSSTLELYVQRGCERKYRSKSFDDRCDTALISLVKGCPRLEVVAIRERVSTATVLLCAYYVTVSNFAPANFAFFIRRNAVIRRFDWAFLKGADGAISTSVYEWVRRNARFYTLAQLAVRELIGRGWRFQNDNEYRHKFAANENA